MEGDKPQKPAYSSSDEFEIGEVESYGNQKDSGFSHQALVMRTMQKALETGCKEMKPGWFETSVDKNGNTSRKYNEDVRLSFISSVESCLMVMNCDLDNEAKKELEKLYKEKNDIKKKLNDMEDAEWNSLNTPLKAKLMQSGKGNMKGFFSKEKIYYQLYLEECVRIYREIFKALTNQTNRLDFYQEETFEA